MNENLLERVSSESLDDILGKEFKVLDKGFIRVVDYMGTDSSIVQAARVSYGKGTKTKSEDQGLISYLMEHGHTTPFEMCEIKVHVKMPIFVARQWVRHRTANINEYSGRYSLMPNEFYIPSPGEIAFQSTNNKQGRGEHADNEIAESVIKEIEEQCENSYEKYQKLLGIENEDGEGLSRELARIILPLNTYTEWYWKIDLHNLFHFLHLRMDSHAQYEIRVYADQLAEIVKLWVPYAWQAFEQHNLDAQTFSSAEISQLKDVIDLDSLKGNGKFSQKQINSLLHKLK